MLHRQRGSGRALGMGRRITAPSYQIAAPSQVVYVAGASVRIRRRRPGAEDTKMWPTLAPAWKQAYHPARRGTMQRVILTVLAFATATVLSTTPVSAINTHAYNGSYCKASNGSQSASYASIFWRRQGVKSGVRSCHV